jgi:dolichol-phosphate mannosyltransferase
MKTMVFIPTLNEYGTIEGIIRTIHVLHKSIEILVIDDNSVDGTLDLLGKLESEGFPLTVVNRGSKKGIGSAHIEALTFAKTHEYDILISMDADGAHDPKFISDFLRDIIGNDLVIGSRYLRSDSLSEWKTLRKLLTRTVHLVTMVFLGLKYDSSSGFRCYKIRSLPESIFTELRSTGYDFFFESLYEMNSHKMRIGEVSIVLPARTYGHSKMTPRLALTALKTLLYVSLRRIKRLGA